MAQSEYGVSLVTWETHAARFLTRLERQAGVAVHEDQEALQALLNELQAYLAGTATAFPGLLMSAACVALFNATYSI